MFICYEETTLPESSFPWYFVFPVVNGMYLYLIICLICLFMVIVNKIMKYITKMGQNTGIFSASKNVQNMAMDTALVALYQNLNSGNLRINGLNSSEFLVGNEGPSSSDSKAGSIL